ncbi:MAG TPA: hypothetical protein VMU12_03155 [Candidatus Paceibacterota bacterium]|nr:hypothetical protein [Candidatus Paceibacterota bacterium]
MWERFFQGVVAGLVIAATAVLLFLLGGFVVLCMHCTPASAPVVATAPVVTPTPVDPTLQAVRALGTKIDNKFGRMEQRLDNIDGRVKRLESLTVPPQPSPSPCCDGWSEETIPPHQ